MIPPPRAMMIQVKLRDYGKVLRPLTNVKINHLFAKSVLEARVDGLVYADSASHPGVFFVVHSYGMSLVFGDPIALKQWAAFWEYLADHARTHAKDEWLQAYPEDLSKAVADYLGFEQGDHTIVQVGTVAERHTRVNFKFDQTQILAIHSSSPARSGVRPCRQDWPSRVQRTERNRCSEILLEGPGRLS